MRKTTLCIRFSVWFPCIAFLAVHVLVQASRSNRNRPPTISDIQGQTILLNHSTDIIPFQISDVETPDHELSVAAESSNKALVANQNIFFGGGGSDRTLLITPSPNQSGTTQITLTVSDGAGQSTSVSFLLIVRITGTPPTISPIQNRTVFRNQPIDLISFNVSDAESSANQLTVSARTSDQSIVSDSNLFLGGDGSNRFLFLNPQLGTSETATITITITVTDPDGQSAVSEFLLGVNPSRTPPIISNIPDQTTLRNQRTQLIPFTVEDSETPVGKLTVTGNSSNRSLVPDFSIFVSGTDRNRSVFISPASGQAGSATITITVTDTDGQSAKETFVLTVALRGTPPTITDIENQIVFQNRSSGPVLFTVADAESPSETLLVSARSSNQMLISDEGIGLGGRGTDRFFVLTPNDNVSGTAAISVSATDPDDQTVSKSFILSVGPVGLAPTLSDIPNQTTFRNQPTSVIRFTVSDTETAAHLLSVTARSSNTSLAPNSNLLLGGSGRDRTLSIVSAANRSGRTTITITVTDEDGQSASDTFELSVNSNGGPPTISDLSDQTTLQNQPTLVIQFTIDDVETSAQLLTVSATSSNPSLVPNSAILLGGIGTERVLVLVPETGQVGITTIRLAVEDLDGHSTSKSFQLTVSLGGPPPSLSDIENQETFQNEPTAVILFIVSDAQTEPASLSVHALSNDPFLVANSNILLGGNDSIRTLQIQPEPNRTGTTTISLTVASVDGRTANTTFDLTVRPRSPSQRNDFNNDDAPDLIFENDQGSTAVWFMNEADLLSASLLDLSKDGDANWTLVGSGDFNQDDAPDLLFQRIDGTLAVWLMNEILQESAALVNPAAPSDRLWRVMAADDFNADRSVDLLFQHLDGTLAIWFMSGLNLVEPKLLEPSHPGDSDWRVAGTGDLNTDGKPDIVFQHSDGTLATWMMNGASLTSATLLNPKHPGDRDWRVAGVSDFNRDSKPDLIFQRRSDGALAVWQMDGIDLIHARLLDPWFPGGSWHIGVP